MSTGGLFARLVPARQAPSADDNARLHAEADEALARAEVEFYAMQQDLQAALDVPLRHRAIKVAAPDVGAEANATASSEPKSGKRLSLAARLAAAAA
ncbi:MAG: hypothetical protein WC684_04730 [Hyphomicrobium sp.]|jgi:hypothetical protein